MVLSLGFDFIPEVGSLQTSQPPSNHQTKAHDETIKCARCRFGGCDVRVNPCGCSFHARCMPLSSEGALKFCPACRTPLQVSGLFLYPMTFDEIDQATTAAEALKASKRKSTGRKRKNSIVHNDTGSSGSGGRASGKAAKASNSKILVAKNDNPAALAGTRKENESGRKRSFDETKEGSGGKDKDPSNCRTGRWTAEEIVFCDKLISLFKDGKLPLTAGTKLNDFLASMLKSKQSRLTKKMKNAKLSSKIFKGDACFIVQTIECIEMSEMEDSFFQSILDLKERAEFKFHMRREWRDMFSNFCLQVGQSLDADAWLSSVEEMDRRVSMARDASRIARRKLMMGYALSQDFQTAEAGVFIERSQAEIAAAHNNEPLKSNSNSDCMSLFHPSETDEVLALLNDDFNDKSADLCNTNGLNFAGEAVADFDMIGKSSILHSSPFLNKVMAYIKRHNVPFEHIDVWVPNVQEGCDSKCLLGFAGCATNDTEIPPGTPGNSHGLSNSIDSDDKFNLLAFGDYSQKFSFSEGCGLPGRVFSSRAPVWQDRANDSKQQFERCGGAMQWGIKTVVGIPLPSPNVGRIVVCLYSRHTRTRDEALLARLSNEFAKLLPTPKWKLVIDMSTPCPSTNAATDVSRTQFPVISSFSSAASMSSQNGVSNYQAASHDNRVNEIIGLLGEELSLSMRTPSESSHLESLTGLRLFLLKSARTPEDKDAVSTLVGSYSSYISSGKSRSDVALMLSKDYSFLMQYSKNSRANASFGLPQQESAKGNEQQHGAIAATTNTLGNASYHHLTDNIMAQQGQNHRQQVDLQFYGASNINAQIASYSMNPSEISLAPSDPSVSFYPIHEGSLEHFRSQSPTMMPILPGSQPSRNVSAAGDNLSVVSH